jgi:hypothetical protein
MKSSRIFLALILFFALASQAQISKGYWMMGGSGSLSNFKTKFDGFSQDVTNFYISPNIGYFVIDKMNIGASGQLTFSNTLSGPTYGLSPYVRYYFLEKEKQINIFSEVSYGFQKQTNTTSNLLQTFNLKAGTVFFLNSSVGLEVALNYLNQKNNQDYQYRIIYLGVGFQIHLEREK